MEAEMIVTLIHTFRLRREMQASLGWMLTRADSHFLDDIGLTRAELADMIANPVVPKARVAASRVAARA